MASRLGPFCIIRQPITKSHSKNSLSSRMETAFTMGELMVLFFVLLWSTMVLAVLLGMCSTSFRAYLGVKLMRIYRTQFFVDFVNWASIVGSLTVLPVCLDELVKRLRRNNVSATVS